MYGLQDGAGIGRSRDCGVMEAGVQRDFPEGRVLNLEEAWGSIGEGAGRKP